MHDAETDTRSAQRRALDEQIVLETKLESPNLPPDAVPRPLESHLAHRKPIAVAGIVENGVVRPLDPSVKLQEHARVTIVATEMK